MSRALYRGLSTPERIRPAQLATQQEADSPTKDREEEGIEDRARNRPVWEACFPHCLRLWIKQNFSPLSSAHKHGPKTPESGSKSWKIGESPGGTPRENSSCFNTGFGSDCLSCSSCDRKPSGFSFLPVFLLCLVGAFVLVIVVGLNRPAPKVVFPPHNYQRAQLLAWRDLLRGGILGHGSLVSNPRELSVCPSDMEDYIPCYNVTSNLEAGFENGLEFEPHCELATKVQCLVPPPKNYRILSKWPGRSQKIWRGNLKIDVATESNRFLVEEDKLKIPAEDQQLRNEVGSHVQEVADRLGLSAVTDFTPAKIRIVLDIGCGLGSLGAHLWDHKLLTMCIAPYEEHGGQVQIALERGFPAMIGSLLVTQLPYPSSSFDLIHCSACGIVENSKDGMPLLEIDRLLRSGGHFVWVLPNEDESGNHVDDAMVIMRNMTSKLGWEMTSPSQHDTMAIWQKTALDIDLKLHDQTRFCERDAQDADYAWHEPLRPCITLPPLHRQISVQDQLVWPSRLQLAETEVVKPGPAHDETGEPHTWTGTVADYWSLLTPDIFSDHPRRLKDEESGPSAHLVRNTMDMNAGHGELNAALIMSGKKVWVMNVIPTSASNSLPFIYDRGLLGTTHDWCEPFPTYPRTYDFLHGEDLLSQEFRRKDSCGLATMFLEMDRILRPEGWVVLRDEVTLIEDARAVANQMRWESRMIEVLGDKEQRLLVCQKAFWKV